MIQLRPDIAIIIAVIVFFLGVIIGVSWYKAKYASSLGFYFSIRKDYGKYPHYIFITIENRGILPIPALYVYIKHWLEIGSNLDKKFYFKAEKELPDLKPGQPCEYTYPLTDENGILLNEWKSLIDNPNYILLLKAGFVGGSQLVHSAKLAKLVVAQILFYYSQDFADGKYWHHLNKKERNMYFEMVESRSYNHYATQKKIYRKLFGRDELRKIRYTFSV